jgi:hypothetical protein
MKKQILVEVILIAVLEVYAGLLTRQTKASLLRVDAAHSVVSANEKIAVLDSVTGIDVLGNVVFPVPPHDARYFAAFVLRDASIRDDLNFWRGVAGSLSKRSGVRLVAYCDGTACAQTIRNSPQSTDFPVIVYGETVGSQALLNADARGNFLLLDRQRHMLGPIAWRTPGQTPQTVLAKVLK